MTYPPPPDNDQNKDPYGPESTSPEPTSPQPTSPLPPQDPFAAPPPANPYTQQPSPPTTPLPSSVPPPTPPYGQQQPYAQQPYQQQPYGYQQAAPPQNSMALTAMILALVGLATWITAPVGAILGHIALKQIRETGESGEGMAKTGIIVGWIITGLGALCCVGYIVVLVAGFGAASFD